MFIPVSSRVFGTDLSLRFCWVIELGCRGLDVGRKFGGGEIARVDL